jgi:hypothetical protein
MQPSPVPDIKTLDYEPQFDQEGEQIGDRPYYNIEIEDAEEFSGILHGINGMLTSVRSAPAWTFVELALNLFLKAYFANDLDQLLWHITVIEALLGEQREGQGLTALIKRRVTNIFGLTNNERKEIGRDSPRFMTSDLALYMAVKNT